MISSSIWIIFNPLAAQSTVAIGAPGIPIDDTVSSTPITMSSVLSASLPGAVTTTQHIVKVCNW